MKTTKMPGFTAESSIYMARERYEMNRDLYDVAEHQGVLPQLRPVDGGGMCKGIMCTAGGNDAGMICWCVP